MARIVDHNICNLEAISLLFQIFLSDIAYMYTPKEISVVSLAYNRIRVAEMTCESRFLPGLDSA